MTWPTRPTSLPCARSATECPSQETLTIYGGTEHDPIESVFRTLFPSRKHPLFFFRLVFLPARDGSAAGTDHGPRLRAVPGLAAFLQRLADRFDHELARRDPPVQAEFPHLDPEWNRNAANVNVLGVFITHLHHDIKVPEPPSMAEGPPVSVAAAPRWNRTPAGVVVSVLKHSSVPRRPASTRKTNRTLGDYGSGPARCRIFGECTHIRNGSSRLPVAAATVFRDARDGLPAGVQTEPPASMVCIRSSFFSAMGSPDWVRTEWRMTGAAREHRGVRGVGKSPIS